MEISNIAKIQHLSKSRRASPDLRQAKAVWKAGAIAFDTKWISKNGATPSAEWMEVFKVFEDADIERGIRRMTADAQKKISTGDDEVWPPNAFEFACYCKRPSGLYFPENTSMVPYLPGPVTPGYGEEQLAAIRQKLRGGSAS